MVPPTICAPRLRNAAATREAMLVAARHHFARESYENVGLREIASHAGVDPALVARYFGGKEQLFKEALRGDARPFVEGVPREELPAHLASLLLDHEKDEDEKSAKVDCLLILLRSSASCKASEIVSEAISEDMLGPMARALTGEHPEIRAGLALAVLMGSGILRSAMGMGPLCEPAAAELRKRLIALFTVALADSVAA
jgi:AcrR family transcriptional regulator